MNLWFENVLLSLLYDKNNILADEKILSLYLQLQ